MFAQVRAREEGRVDEEEGKVHEERSECGLVFDAAFEITAWDVDGE